jgi:hypothetical protein
MLVELCYVTLHSHWPIVVHTDLTHKKREFCFSKGQIGPTDASKYIRDLALIKLQGHPAFYCALLQKGLDQPGNPWPYIYWCLLVLGSVDLHILCSCLVSKKRSYTHISKLWVSGHKYSPIQKIWCWIVVCLLLFFVYLVENSLKWPKNV